MKLRFPPELADGGYWYAVPVVPDPDNGGKSPGVIPGTGWCAWYSGEVAVVRCPEAVAGLASLSSGQIEAVLAANGFVGKPPARVGGS